MFVFQITSLTIVPPLAVMLCKSGLLDKYDLSHVQNVSCGAAPLKYEQEMELKEKLAGDKTHMQQSKFFSIIKRYNESIQVWCQFETNTINDTQHP